MTTHIEDAWATVASWCDRLPQIQWYNCFGFVMIAVYNDAGHYCYSVSPCGIDEVPTLERAEFLARLAWRRTREEMPALDASTEPLLLPGIGLLGVHLHRYWQGAQTLDEAMASQLSDPISPDLGIGDRLIAYRRIPASNMLGWVMRQWKVVLYLGDHPINPPYVAHDPKESV